MGQGDDGGWRTFLGRRTWQVEPASVQCFGCGRSHRPTILARHFGVCQCGRVITSAAKLGSTPPKAKPRSTGSTEHTELAKLRKEGAQLRKELAELRKETKANGQQEDGPDDEAPAIDIAALVSHAAGVEKLLGRDHASYKALELEIKEARQKRDARKPLGTLAKQAEDRVVARKKAEERANEAVRTAKEALATAQKELEAKEAEQRAAEERTREAEAELRRLRARALEDSGPAPGAPSAESTAATTAAASELKTLLAKLGSEEAARAQALVDTLAEGAGEPEEEDAASDASAERWDEAMAEADAILTEDFAKAAAEAHASRQAGEAVPQAARKALLAGFKLATQKAGKTARPARPKRGRLAGRPEARPIRAPRRARGRGVAPRPSGSRTSRRRLRAPS